VSQFRSQRTTLCRRVTAFLEGRSCWQRQLREFLDDLQDRCKDVYIFGGALRDWTVFGSGFIPRDLDIVVDGCEMQILETAFRSVFQRHTRFGGLRLSIGGLPIDLWRLRDTWPIREGFVADCSIEGLAATAFLTTDAVAFNIAEETSIEAIAEAGFFESIALRLVELNLEATPSPVNCIVHALDISDRTGYNVGPKLARFMLDHSRETLQEMEAVQLRRFGTVRYPPANFSAWINAYRNRRSAIVSFGTRRETQLELLPA
jgi:hypothetical protein